MKALFVVNERSGARRKFDVREVIRGACAWDFELVPSGEKEELDAVVDRAEAEGFDVVYAVGGDGTVHETAKRLIGRKPALGILPIGSGNGFARHIGLPMNPAKSLDACRGGRIVTIDTARVNDQPFLGVMGVGLDAVIAHRFASSTIRGLGTYIRVGTRAFTAYRSEEYQIEVKGETLHRRAFVIAVANSGQYGNNARVAPLASLRDGLLDLVIVDAPTPLRSLVLLMRLFDGTLHRSPGVTSLQAEALTIHRAAPGEAHLDGEPVLLPATLHVQVVPRSLRLLVPDNAEAF